MVGDVPVAVRRGGDGPPLLVLHDELGFPGWMSWNDRLAATHELIVPMQPAYGQTPKVDWIRSYRDLGGFYARMVREQGWRGAPVIGFSAGAYVAAEMAAACPDIFSRMVLVGPLGLRPTEGEIFDFLAVTIRTHVAATVSKIDAPEFADDLRRRDDARAVRAVRGRPRRDGPDRLGAVHVRPQPRPSPRRRRRSPDAAGAGQRRSHRPGGLRRAPTRPSCPNSTTVSIDGAGHRPEIEDPDAFLSAVTAFLGG